MITDELKITQSVETVENVLDKVELIALYADMSRKEASGMRLVAEELLSALTGTLQVYDGRLWMDTDGGKFALHVRIDKPDEKYKREKLASLAKSDKAAPKKGFFAKLGAALQEFLLSDDDDSIPMIFMNHSVYTGDLIAINSTYIYHYMQSDNSKSDEASAPVEPDELSGIEKKIIDSIVDDIIVSVSSEYMEIIALKKSN